MYMELEPLVITHGKQQQQHQLLKGKMSSTTTQCYLIGTNYHATFIYHLQFLWKSTLKFAWNVDILKILIISFNYV
jgi:hypothetical protein